MGQQIVQGEALQGGQLQKARYKAGQVASMQPFEVQSCGCVASEECERPDAKGAV